MKRRKTRGTFAEQKKRHADRQRLFDDVLAARTEPRSFRFGRYTVRSRPDLSDGTKAVVAVRRGYALVEVSDSIGAATHVLASSRSVGRMRNGFALDHIVFWCDI